MALLNNCPMHGEFPSDAWLKMNAREKSIFKSEINVFSTKIFEYYDKRFLDDLFWYLLSGMLTSSS